MVLATSRKSTDYIGLAASLAEEFAQTAIERDVKGGSPAHELNRLYERESIDSIASGAMFVPTRYTIPLLTKCMKSVTGC